MGERDAQIAVLTQGMGERDAQIAVLTQELQYREEIITDLVSSTSWRLTRPVRALKTFVNLLSSKGKGEPFKGEPFDAKWYLKMYPDVASSGIDPWEHYAKFGKSEGRQPVPDHFFLRNIKRVQILTGLLPYAVKRAGGFFNLLRIVFSTYSEKGFAGVREQLLNTKGHQRLENAAKTKKDEIVAKNIVFSPQQGYQLQAGLLEYTYIPPRKPDNMKELLDGMMDRLPTFTVVVPIYNTPSVLLEKVVESVKAQWYPHWQLVLVDDASQSPQTKSDLSKIDDPRIQVLWLESNHGIAGATNAGFERATGEFVVLLDHDDELTEDCLYELAVCISHESPDYIYSDEDKISPEGRFIDPHFKPAWSPDTMMSTMYVCHVSCIRRELLLELKGLRSEYNGCQDWDLVLRIAEKTDKIRHIPKVLYHWRIIPASIASDIGAKSYVLEASRRVREDALKRRGQIGTVEPIEQMQGYFRVNYHLQGKPLISIVIPTRDNGKILARCIDSIHQLSTYRNYEIVILDNGSVEADTLATLEQLCSKNNVRIIRHDAPFNFSELNNIGAHRAQGEILLFLNDDTEVLTPDWLQRMGGYAQLPHIGAVGAKLLYPGAQLVQHSGIVNLQDGPGHAFVRKPAGIPGYFMRNLLEYNWIAVTGACMMIEARKFHDIGKLDETFPVAYNDIELSMRLCERGFYNVVCQATQLIHHESISRGVDHLNPEKMARLQREKQHLFDVHPQYYQHDPFYSPNLHPNGINFEYPN